MIKKLNKKAFTLVELIGVFAVLAIVFGLVSIAYININKSMVKTYYRGIELSMTNASGDYYSNNKNKVPMVVGEIDSVSLGELEEQEFIDPVKDVSGNRCDTTNSYVKTYRDEKENLQYLICLKCYDGYESESCQERDINFKYVELYGTLLNSNGSNLIETNKPYREGVYVNKSVMLHIKTQEGVKIVLTKENDNNFREEYNAANIGSGRFGYNYATSTSGNYIIYGVYGENKKTLEQHLNVLIDKEMPSYTIVDGGETILAVDSSTNKAYLKINVVGISDSLSGIKRIRYSFEPNNNENYINVDSTETEFEIEKNLDVGNYKLKISVTDNAGNVNTREVVYRVYRFVDKPTTAICNTLTYNGNPQTLISTTNSGYSYQNNSGTNANNYNVKLVLNSGYAWSDKTVTDYQVQCSIGKANINFSCTNKAYNGQSQTIASCTGCSSMTNSTRTVAGTQKVTPVPDSNHKTDNNVATAKSELTCGITKININFSCANKAYNGQSQTIASCTGCSSMTNSTRTAAGTQKVTPVPDSNHKTDDNVATAKSELTCGITKININFSCANKAYNGQSQTIASCTGCSSMTNSTRKNAGTQKVIPVPDSNHKTDDNVATAKSELTCGITKINNPITVTASQSWSANYSTSNQTKTITAASKAQGTVTYSIKSQKNSSGTSVSKFSISSTTLTMAGSTAVGTYTVVITATAAGDTNYNPGSKEITMTVTVTEDCKGNLCSLCGRNSKLGKCLVDNRTNANINLWQSGVTNDTNNYRYTGTSSEAKNYICFGNNVDCRSGNNKGYLYRIIGVFGSSKQLRLVRVNKLTETYWRPTATNTPLYDGSNLKTQITNFYNNSYGNKVTGNTTWKSLIVARTIGQAIDDDTGGSRFAAWTPETMLTCETGGNKSRNNTSEYVTPIPLSDLLLSTRDSSCKFTSCYKGNYGNNTGNEKITNSWLYSGEEWSFHAYNTTRAYVVTGTGRVCGGANSEQGYCTTEGFFSSSSNSCKHQYRAIIQLNENVLYCGGSGTSNNPYIVGYGSCTDSQKGLA